jgi:hypothetical protein
LEKRESTEAGSTGASTITGSARVRAVGANSSSRSNRRVGASYAIVERRAGCATRSTVDAFSLIIVIVLIGKASFLAD